MTELIPLAEHETVMAAAYEKLNLKLTGIACPTCQSELKWTGPPNDTTHKRPVACTKPSCAYTGEAYG